MKILMVTMQMCIGGAETHILELCRELTRMGHDVTLASNGGVYADMLAQEGIVHIRLPLHTKTPSAVIRSWQGLAQCLREGEYDIVHAHARIPAWICGQLWEHFRRHPIIKNGRQVPLFRFVTTAHLNFSINPLWRRISHWGERTMSVSEDIVDYLVAEYGCSRDRIRTTINGINMDKFSPEVDPSPIFTEFGLSSSPDRCRLVYMSRLDSDRAAYAYSITRIAPALAEKYPHLDILIVGGGTEEEAIRRLAREANEKAGRQVIHVTGSRSDTHLFTAAADVFVGVSRSALEAMAAAKPVIVAGNQGVLGIFEESKLQTAMDTNFCCRGCGDYTDQQLLADIEALLDMPAEKRAAMGAYCRQVVSTYYTCAKMAADYEALYRQALAAPVVFAGRGDVLLSGYYGFGNMGDESLLRVIADSLAQACPGVRISVLTKHPKKDSRRTGLHCINRMNMLSIWREMGKIKLFISGGGSLLQDVTSGKSLRYYAALLALAQKRRVKTYIYANGIGPIRSTNAQVLVGKVAAACDTISVRDPDSMEALTALGVPAEKIRCSADPAFMFRAPSVHKRTALLRRLGIDTACCGDNHETKTVGYFVLSLRLLRGKRETQADQRLAEEMAAFCDAVWENYGLRPILVPMQPQTDIRICTLTGERMHVPYTIADVQSPEELLALLTGARFALAMRLHCLIYAAAASIPVMGLSYDPKIDALMQCLEQEAYVFPAETVCASALSTSLRSLLETEDRVREEITKAVDLFRTRCGEDVQTAVQMLQNHKE